MKRKLLAAILSIAMVGTMLMGCSSGGDTPAASDSETESTDSDAADDGEAKTFGYTCMDGTNPFFVTIEATIRDLTVIW